MRKINEVIGTNLIVSHCFLKKECGYYRVKCLLCGKEYDLKENNLDQRCQRCGWKDRLLTRKERAQLKKEGIL